MPYCPSCGVEVTTKACPLCNYIIKQDIHTKPFSHEVIKKNNPKKLSLNQKRDIVNTSIWFLSLTAIGVCLTVNYLVSQNITWSLIPGVPILFLGIFTSIIMYSKKIARIILLFIGVLSMLILLDLVIKGVNTMSISIPLTILLFILLEIIFTIFKKAETRGANIIGFILMATSIYLVGIELTIKYSLGSSLNLSWSLLTTVILVPISVFFFYIHYNLSKKVNLKRVFHT
jgi:hypothetical protein